jgi:hypothetical protein
MNPYTFSLALGATGLVVMALGGLDIIRGTPVIRTTLPDLAAHSAAMAIMVRPSPAMGKDTRTRVTTHHI